MQIILGIWIILSILFIAEPQFSYLEFTELPTWIHQFIAPEQLAYTRLLGIILMALIAYSVIPYAFPKYKVQSLIIFLTIPWVFVVSHEFNPAVYLCLAFCAIYVRFPKFRRVTLAGATLLILYLYHTQDGVERITTNITFLLSFASLTNLFLQMEPISSYLSVPRQGNFPYHFLLAVIPFAIHRDNLTLRRIQQHIPVLIFALTFFLVYPRAHLIFAGVGILFIMTLMLIMLLNRTTTIHKSVSIILLVMSVVHFIYFVEAYVRQYPRKYSVERGEAQWLLVEHIAADKDKSYYVPPDEEVLNLLEYYRLHYDLQNITIIQDEASYLEVLPLCQSRKHQCVLNDMWLDRLGIEKDSTPMESIRLTNTLGIYYIY